MLKIIKVAIIPVALVLGIDSYVNAQAPAKSTQIKTADSLFLAGDYAHAKTAYKSLVNDTSKNGIWWNRLAFSYYNTGDFDTALKYYQKALTLKAGHPLKASIYSRMARVNALQNNAELAYASIDSAVAKGFFAFKELDTLKDFDKIRDSERFKQLRTTAFNDAFPCMANKQAREFDFWVGEWKVYVTGTKQVAGHSVIQRIAGGCAILENWTSNNAMNNGKSINFIDPVTNKWKQSWAGGGVQEFVNGEYKDGAMRFTFETTGPQNQKLIGRFTFYNQSNGDVRQFNETSADNGNTWATSYDFTYVKVGGSKEDL
jgi:hypothetical protein